MLPNSVLLTLLPLLFTSVTSSPSIPPSERYHPKSRHSYSQYLSTTDGAPYLSPAQYEDAHSREIGKDTRYGFENPVLAAHYSSLSPDLAGSGLEYTGSEIDIAEKEDVSPTWLDEMAVMGHAQQAYQQQHETVAGLGDSTSAYKEKNKKPAEPFPPTPYPPYITDGNYWGIRTFAHLPPLRCTTTDSSTLFDVSVLGAPFDTSTSWRPGARFGPSWIRHSSQRIGGHNALLRINPFTELKMVDCGDSRMSFYSNEQALRQLEGDYEMLLGREMASRPMVKDVVRGGEVEGMSIALDGKHHPRIFMLGGDHTIVLPALRGLAPIYGPITVIHFDSHADSRHPRGDPLTHGDYFYFAHQEGLLANNSIHAGIRVPYDNETDKRVGFEVVGADEIEDIGYGGVIDRILERVGDSPVYITIDIDTLDPAFAPSTGTPEIGGWTTREMKKILHGLKGLRIVGADVVEVIESYDGPAQTTGIAAAGLAFEVLSLMALQPLVQRS